MNSDKWRTLYITNKINTRDIICNYNLILWIIMWIQGENIDQVGYIDISVYIYT